MKIFRDVIDGYIAAKSLFPRVPGKNNNAALNAIRNDIPQLISNFLDELGRSTPQYRVYGGFGQSNFHFARIPCVSMCDRRISKSTQRGYFIVILFREDMSGFYLSLNQGYSQFNETYGSDDVALKYVQKNADRLASVLDIPAVFEAGPVDLRATNALGRGYERGAIASRFYDGKSLLEQDQFKSDFAQMLALLDRLIFKFGNDIIGTLPTSSEADFQEAAVDAGVSGTEPDFPPGPLPVPPRMPGSNGGGYRRNATVSGAALKAANFLCEIDPTHALFIARKKKNNYVEAHHLIPMSMQGRLDVSIDVIENVVALCPHCHRMLHHGLFKDKKPLLLALHTSRKSKLEMRGINLAEAEVLQIYRSDLEDEV